MITEITLCAWVPGSLARPGTTAEFYVSAYALDGGGLGGGAGGRSITFEMKAIRDFLMEITLDQPFPIKGEGFTSLALFARHYTSARAAIRREPG